MGFEKEKFKLEERILVYEWRGKIGGETLDTYDNLQKSTGSLEGWVQDPRCLLFNFSELLLSSPFEIFIEFTEYFIYGQQRWIFSKKQREVLPRWGSMTNTLDCPNRQSWSPQQQMTLCAKKISDSTACPWPIAYYLETLDDQGFWTSQGLCNTEL